ncbi:hypothetical protein GJAV_G00106180 [Gymnothorax javanicus]|nr:hypothetical protein GJAV_G00106180 [Gymnothorax javanicus]
MAWVNPDGSSSSTGIIIGCVVGALILLALAAIGVFVWKKRSSGYKKTGSEYIYSCFTQSCECN